MRSHKYLVGEISRYLLVGGGAFIIDFSTLFLLRTFVFKSMGHIGILLATAIGFTAGLIFTYIFSLVFVFKNIDPNQNNTRSFVLFIIIGFAGFFVTELFMHGGVLLLGQKWYLAVKVFTAAIVFTANYLFRKFVIFKSQ